MPTVDALKSGVSEQRREKADAAVRVFRQLQPTLTSYARMLSGRKDIRIEVAARDNGSTDGTRIFYRPPIELGDKTPHERRLCDRRGDDGRMLCEACRIRESVLVTIYHEIAHICHDSFAATSDADRRRAINFAIRETGGKYAEKVTNRIKTAPAYLTSSYMGLAQLINEHLPFLVNCLEDARVNAALFEVRPGVRLMFYVDTKQIFDEGYECMGKDGKPYVQEWNKAPLNSQVMIGCFCKASGYKYEGWFHSKVETALNDTELTALIATMNHTSTIGGVFALSFKVLARLRDLGFCGTPQDPDPEPEPTEEPSDESDNSEGMEDSSDVENAEPPDGGEGSSRSDAGEPSETSDDDGTSGNASDSDGSEESPGGAGGRSETDGSDGDETAEPSREGGVDDKEASSSEGSSDGDSDDSESPNEAGEGSAGSSERDSSRDGGGDSGENDGEDESSEGAGGQPSSESHMAQDSDVDFSGESDDSDLPNGGDRSGLDDGVGELESLDGDDQGSKAERTDGQLSDAGDGDSEDSKDNGTSGANESDDEAAIDTGADDGYGGTEIIGEPDPPMGEPGDIDPILKKWGQHEEKPKSVEATADEDAVATSIVQGLYFTKPSTNVRGVVEHYYDVPEEELGRSWKRNPKPTKFGQQADLDVPESVLQPAVLHLRRAFTDNQIAAMQGNLKSGRVNRRVLGKRAWNDDDRLFNKKKLPGKQDWFVVIGMDVSGSTSGVNIALEKRVVYAQAEMLNRVGIPFAVYAHTGKHEGGWDSAMNLEMYHVKDAREPWNDTTQERLARIGPSSANLDGHALEFLRKRADESPASNKIILYYSDGKMPLENFYEELEILQDEIAYCKRRQYTLLGVGIRTDSPRAHGLDTVQVDTDDDLLAVVKHLAKRIAGDF